MKIIPLIMDWYNHIPEILTPVKFPSWLRLRIRRLHPLQRSKTPTKKKKRRYPVYYTKLYLIVRLPFGSVKYTFIVIPSRFTQTLNGSTNQVPIYELKRSVWKWFVFDKTDGKKILRNKIKIVIRYECIVYVIFKLMGIK